MANIIIGTKGIRRSMAERARLMSEVLEAWWELDKQTAKDFMTYIHEITKVQHNSGEWKSGKGFVKLQLPGPLFHSLNRSFNQFLPDEPGFAQGEFGDEDIKILYILAPNLKGSRKKKA